MQENEIEKKNKKIFVIVFIVFLIIAIVIGVISGLSDIEESNPVRYQNMKLIFSMLVIVFLTISILIAIYYFERKWLKKHPEYKSKIKTNYKSSNTNLLIKCKSCGNKISKNASNCPHCGEPINFTEEELNKALKEANSEENWKIIGIIIIVISLIVIAALNGGVIPLFTIRGEGTMTIEPVDDDIEYDSWDY